MTSPRHVTAQGLLVRKDGGFALRLDGGGIVMLDLSRTPVDHVEKRVRVDGRLIADDRMEVEAIAAIDR
jgi:hypothetical protein